MEKPEALQPQVVASRTGCQVRQNIQESEGSRALPESKKEEAAMKRVHLTARYARYRVREPSRFDKSSLRTVRAGKWARGKAKLIRGALKSSGAYHTQAVLLKRKAYRAGYRVKRSGGKFRLTKKRKKR